MLIKEELKKMKSLMGVSVTKEPNLNDEMDELQRVSQYLSRDEGINLNIDELSTAFRKSTETPLNDKIWKSLENTESNQIQKGDMDSVVELSKKYNKSDPYKLQKSIEDNTYERPLIIKFGDRYHLVAGNTRLSTAAAMGVIPMVFIAEISNNLNEQFDNTINKIRDFMGIKKIDDPKKADIVSDDVKSFINDLERVNNLSEQHLGSIEYKRDVETLQIALILSGYPLPKYGVDGLFGPETASSVNKFKQDNNIEIPKGPSIVNSDMSQILVGKIKQKGITPQDLKPYLDPVEINKTNLGGSNKEKVLTFFIGKGLSKEQASGIAGNLSIESNLNPNAVGDNGTSFGIAQWHNERWGNLIKFCKEKGLNSRDLVGQLEFLWWELNNGEIQALRRLKSTNSSSDAAIVFAKYYERPDSSTYSKRVSASNQIFTQLA